MADKSVGELIAAQSVTPTDLFVLEQNGTAKKLTGQILENWLVSFADGHGGIQSITKLKADGLVDTYRITLADTTTFDFFVTNGRNVNSVTKTGTSGLVDTYTISYNDNTSETFTVTNGEKGDKGDNQYVWIKYASQKPTASSHSFGDVADNWIGVYSGDSATAPTDWTQYEWFQIKGEKGDTGAAATLTSSKVEYQVSNSGSIIPSGEWSESVAVVPQGKYLWTRVVHQFNTGDPVTSYSVSRMGMDGSGSVSSVAGISPNADGNVPLEAEDVGAVPSTGGEMTGGLKMNGQPISGLNAPTANDQAANMGFVNQQVRRAAPRNLLDNSDFTNPVNQRGVTSKTGPVLTHIVDRWYINLQEGVTATLTESGLSVSGDCFIQQRFEKGYLQADTVYTSAVYYSDGSVELSSKPQFNNSGFDVITINIEANKTVASIVLYEGEYTAETMPEYQPKGYGVELVECQRYYQRSYITEPNNVYIAHLLTAGSRFSVGTVFFYVPMRITPTVTIYNPVTGKSGGVSKWSDDTNVPVDHEQNVRCFHVNSFTGVAVKGETYALSYEASADL